MASDTKKLGVAFAVFAFLVMFIYSMNSQIEQESERILNNSQQESKYIDRAKPVGKSIPKPVVIDPENDPLAPVRARVHERTAQERAQKKKASKVARPVYEIPENGDIFVQ